MSLRTINKWLRRVGLTMYVTEVDGDLAERIGRTHFSIRWIGLPGSRMREEWESLWFSEDVPHMPELAPRGR